MHPQSGEHPVKVQAKRCEQKALLERLMMEKETVRHEMQVSRRFPEGVGVQDQVTRSNGAE